MRPKFNSVSELQTDDRYFTSKRPTLSEKLFFAHYLLEANIHSQYIDRETESQHINWPTVMETLVGAGFKTQELLSSSSLFTNFLSCVDCMKTNNSFNQQLFFFFFQGGKKKKGRNAFTRVWKRWNSLQHIEKGLDLRELLTWICF